MANGYTYGKFDGYVLYFTHYQSKKKKLQATGTSVSVLFLIRMELLFSKNFQQGYYRYVSFLIKYGNHLFPIFFSPVMWAPSLLMTDQAAAKRLQAEWFGNITELLYEEKTLAIDVTNTWWQALCVLLCIIGITLIAMITIICPCISFWILNQQKENMSEKTKTMHRTWLKSLIAQVSYDTSVLNYLQIFRY